MSRIGKPKHDRNYSSLAKLLSYPGAVLILIGRPFFYLTLYVSYSLAFGSFAIYKTLRLFFLSIASYPRKLAIEFKSLLKNLSGLSNKSKGGSYDQSSSGKKQISDPEVVDWIVHKSFNTIESPKYRRVSILKLTAYMILSIIIVTGLLGYSTVYSGLPSVDELTTRDTEVSTKIYDRNGELLYTIYKDENRTLVSLNDIPEHAILATLAIEDAEFYKHPGFSIQGITRAIIKNYKENTLYGGSTITQQLVKNTLLSSEKTFLRKLRELALAVQVERHYTKDQILEMYLNEVSYGGTSYGIQQASQAYFGKDVGELNLAESALLAGLPKSPSRYSPFGLNPEYAKGRQEEVLNLMEINGFIDSLQRQEALSTQIEFAQNKIDIKAPHFVMYVREQLENNFGKEVVEKGGLTVVTTLDLAIQELAEKVVEDEIDSLRSLNVNNAAVVVLDPSSGEILAMVGSRDYFDTPNDGNVNVTTSLRQPGSSIKVVNYAYALSNGMTPASIIADTPEKFVVVGQPEYDPVNYDGTYRGNITLRSALAESRNLPAVKVLNKYGVNNMIDLGNAMGITTWEDRSRFGLSLTLGGGEIRLIDMARVYATLANYGKSPRLKSLISVKNYKGVNLENEPCNADKPPVILANAATVLADSGKTILQKDNPVDCEPEKVLDERVAYMITDILKDNEARTPAFGSRSALVIANHPEVAVKTGTSNNLRDNLTIGYNQNYVVAVWVGNNDNSPMSRVASGVTGASPIFNKIMSALLSDKDSKDWQIPSGIVQLPICPYTGTLACSGCPVVNEWFLEENKPTNICHTEWFDKEKEEDVRNGFRIRGRILPEAARTSN